MRKIFAACVVVFVCACGGDSVTGPTGPTTGTVYFKVDLLTCGAGTAVINYYIDGSVVGAETATAGVLSKGYTVAAGSHLLGAKIPANDYTWPNTTFVVQAGGSITDILPCS